MENSCNLPGWVRVDTCRNNHSDPTMKTATFSILAITAAPAATFVLGLSRLAPETSFALAASLAIAAFALDALFVRPLRGRG